MSDDHSEFIDPVSRRPAFLDLLSGGPIDRHDITATLDASRSTVTRALDSLEAAGLVDRTEDGYVTTVTGRLALRHYRSYVMGAEGIAAASDVLSPLSPDCPIDPAVLVDAEIHRTTDPTPYRPVEQLHDTIADATRYRSVLPTLDDLRHLQLLSDHAVVDTSETETVLTPALLGTLAEDQPRYVAGLHGSEHGILAVGDLYEFGLASPRDRRARRSLPSCSPIGRPSTVSSETDGDAAVRWAERRYEAVRTDAVPVDDRDGDVPAPADRPVGAARLASLRRRGFDRLDADFLSERVVAAPLTAWQVDLGLEEVNTGSPIDAASIPGGDDGATRRRRHVGV